MPELHESNYLEKKEEFDPELIAENIEALNSIKEFFSKELIPFYLDSEYQIPAYAYRIQPQDSERIYTIPTDADYIVLSPYGATIFKLFNTTNPENSNDVRKYNPSFLTKTGLATITKHLIEHSKNRSVIDPAIKQEDESREEVFLILGVNLPNLAEIYQSGDPFLRYIDWRDRKEKKKREKKNQKSLNKLYK